MRATTLRTDTRAQSVGVARLFLSLGAAAMVWWVMDAVTEPIFDMAPDSHNTPEAAAATGWFEWIVANSPLFFALITFFGLLVLSIYQSERV